MLMLRNADGSIMPLVKAPNFSAMKGAPGLPAFAYSTLDFQGNSVYSHLYVGTLASLPASPVYTSDDSMVIRQFRLLILAREVLDANGTLDEARQSIHEAPYSVEKAYGQARRFTMPALEFIYCHLLAMDEAAKTGAMPLELGLETFVVELARK